MNNQLNIHKSTAKLRQGVNAGGQLTSLKLLETVVLGHVMTDFIQFVEILLSAVIFIITAARNETEIVIANIGNATDGGGNSASFCIEQRRTTVLSTGL